MKAPRQNQYEENPHPPGTFAAAGWDVSHSLHLLVGLMRDAFLNGLRPRR